MNPVQAQPTDYTGERAAPLQLPSFTQIFRDYGPFVWRTLRAHGVPERHLDDACQEVFLTIFRRLDSFEGRSALRTWIYGICLRVSMNSLRRAHMRREVPVEVLPDGGAAPAQERALESKELAERLMLALSALPVDRREVYRLYEIEGLTMPEVARIVGCPLSTAYSRLHAARRDVEAALLGPQDARVADAAASRGQARCQALRKEGRRRAELALSVVALEIPPREALTRLADRLGQPAAVAASAGGVFGASSFVSGWKTAAALAAMGLAASSALQLLPAVRHAHAAPAVLVSTPGSEAAGVAELSRRVLRGVEVAAAARPAAPTPQATAAPRRKRPSARRGRPNAPARPAAATTVTDAGALSGELGLLLRAQRTLDSKPLKTLALLDEHEREFRHSAFVQEREALAIEALVKAGRGRAAEARAARFAKRFSNSAYARRIAGLLGPESASEELADSR